MVIRELVTKLGFSLNKGQLDGAEKATGRIKDRAEMAAVAFRNMAAAFASFATIKSIVAIGDDMQNLRARIGLLPQTVDEVGAAFDEVAAHANKTRASVHAYTTLYVRLGNAGKKYIADQGDLLNITDTVSKALVVGGATVQESASMMLQYSQAIGSGVLQGQEFNAVAEAAPMFLEKLAEAMGYEREQLKKLASENKITSRQLIEATRKVKAYFDEQFVKMPMTVGQAATIIVNRWSLMIDKMNRKTLFITKIAASILAAFDKIEAGLKSIVKSFGGLENMLRLVGITLAVALGAKAISILATFRKATLLAFLPFLKIALIIGAVALALEDLYVWINGGDSLIGAFIGKWEDVKYKILGVVSAIGAIVTAFLVFKAAVIGSRVAIVAYQAAIVAAIAISKAAIVTQYLLAAAVFALNSALGISPIGIIILAIGALIAAGVLLIANWETVKEWFSGFFSWLGDKFERLGKWVAGIFSGDISIGAAVGDVYKKAATGIAHVAKSGMIGGAEGVINAVAPTQLSPAAMGTGRPNVQSNTNVTVTVPPGTTAEQSAFLQNSAQQSFGRGADDRLARDLAVYAP